ncbi:ankyrin repeat domain-containing protein [Candidatus Babeliales bacterium]|nr:ankyrin repeat domain-containing protein [Candidatus Babeliales bacterium]
MKKTLLLLLTLSKFLYSSLYSTGNPIIGSIQGGESIGMIIKQIRNVPELVNKSDECGLTALHYAARRPELTAIISTLIGHGANPNQLSPNGKAPIHMAARNNNTDALIFLIPESEIDIQSPFFKKTPLHEAAIGCAPEAYALLEISGAKTRLKTSLGKTALELTKIWGPVFLERVNLVLMGNLDW